MDPVFAEATLHNCCTRYAQILELLKVRTFQRYNEYLTYSVSISQLHCVRMISNSWHDMATEEFLTHRHSMQAACAAGGMSRFQNPLQSLSGVTHTLLCTYKQ